MASVFPDPMNGGTLVRDSDGNPVPAPNVQNAYIPASDFTVSCAFTMLAGDCFSVVAPAQVNAIVSELLCFAETLDPTGEWDCTTLCNISTAFTTYMENFSSAAIGDQICGLPDGAGTEAAPRLVYCWDGDAFGLPITGDDSLFTLFFDAMCAAEVVAADYADAMVLYCGNGGLKKTSVFSIQLFRGEYVQAYSYSPNQMVRRNGALWSPNAAIPAGTPFVVGTLGQTWYEVSPSAAPVWAQANAYKKDDVVVRNGAFYAANADIPAGTAFTFGDTGATWRVIDPMRTRILDFSAAKIYRKDEVVTVGGLIYRARQDMPAGAYDAALWELIGGELNIYRGTYDQASAYRARDLVLRNGRFYEANAAIPANTPFAIGTTGATWRRVGVDGTFEIVSSITGGWDANELLWVYPATTDFALPVGLAGSRVVLQGAPLLNTVVSIRRNGVEVGQIVFTSGVATFNFPAEVLITGGTGVLSLVATDAAAFTAFAFNLTVERRQ